MPLYFFDINGESRDQNGVEYDGLAEAKCGAAKMAGQIMCDDAETFWEAKEWGMTVTDADGLSLFAMSSFATEAAAISGGR